MIYQQVTSIKSLGTGDKVKIKSPFNTKPRERCVRCILTGHVSTFERDFDAVLIALDKPDPRDGSNFRRFSALMVSKGYIWVKQ